MPPRPKRHKTAPLLKFSFETTVRHGILRKLGKPGKLSIPALVVGLCGL
jgi:hypothetical protein